jgi:hypothetical protein
MSRVVAVLVLCALSACDWFDDPTPTQVTLSVTGEAGTMAELVLSTQFVAGVTDAGVTQVQIFLADTLVRPLPIDTVVSIAVDRRFFAEVSPLESAIAEYRIRVNVDDRRLFDETGDVLAASPFRYVYSFNQATTRVIEVF